MLLYLISWFQAQMTFLRREEGQDLAEYALLIALIALAAVAAVTAMGGSIQDALESVASTIANTF